MILASQSPRRSELLREAGYNPNIHPADIDETPYPHEHPKDLVLRLARTKARAVRDWYIAQENSNNHRDSLAKEPIIAADTIVWTDDEQMLGKPHSQDEARAMLKKLSGKVHFVSTGVCILRGAHKEEFVDTAEVAFYPLADNEIEAYIQTDEPYDKAGAYAIQGHARRFIKGINGDFYTVMGLPIAHVTRVLEGLPL